jgi:autoinducer 2-degrading protein
MSIRLLFVASLAFSVAVASYAQTPAATAPAGNATPPTTFVVQFKVKPGRNADFEKVFRDTQKSVRDHEPGNIYYDFYVDQKDPQLYVIVERYKDAAATVAHGQSEHARKMVAAIRDLLDGPVNAQRLILISSKT